MKRYIKSSKSYFEIEDANTYTLENRFYQVVDPVIKEFASVIYDFVSQVHDVGSVDKDKFIKAACSNSHIESAEYTLLEAFKQFVDETLDGGDVV